MKKVSQKQIDKYIDDYIHSQSEVLIDYLVNVSKISQGLEKKIFELLREYPHANNAKVVTHMIGKVSSRSYQVAPPIQVFYNSSPSDITNYLEKYKEEIKKTETYQDVEQGLIANIFLLNTNSYNQYCISLIDQLREINNQEAAKIESFLRFVDIVVKNCDSFYKEFLVKTFNVKTDLKGVDAFIFSLNSILDNFNNSKIEYCYFHDYYTKETILSYVSNILTVYNYMQLEDKITNKKVSNSTPNKL